MLKKLMIEFEVKTMFWMSIIEPRICRALLWHTGKDLPGHTSYQRGASKILFVNIGNVYLAELSTLGELRAYVGDGAYVQVDNWLYIRKRELFASAAACTSYPWFLPNGNYSTRIGITNSSFFVSEGTSYKTGLISGYKFKIESDDNDYSQIKFSSFNFDVIVNKILPVKDKLMGSYTVIRTEDNIIQRNFIENTVFKLDTVKIMTKDLRSSLKQNVLDQKFMPFEFTTNLGTDITYNAVDQDVLKTLKSDAIGYCVGAPATCGNGDAKDAVTTRYYRVCYGRISAEKVEVRQEAGWLAIPYSTVQKEETLPNGLIISTTYIEISAAIVHPPKQGSTEPDYDCTPREVRVTGTFHSERANITRPLEIIKYLFERYTSIPWSNNFMNIPELTAELAPLNNAPIGIFLDESMPVFDVIAKIQNGSIMGFKFTEYNSLFTARLHNPNRAVKYKIRQADIINLFDLELDSNGTVYVSDGCCKYAKIWSEKDLYSEIRDEELRQNILNSRGLDKSGVIETLLKNESDARTRFNNFMNSSKTVTPRISGIKMHGYQWADMREYDIANMDFGNLTNIKTWYILNMEYDYQTNDVTVDVMAKL